MNKDKIRIVFIGDKNNISAADEIISILERDWNANGQPGRHFYNNREIIRSAFYENLGAVATYNGDIIGYMVFDDYVREIISITIVETFKKYRGLGVPSLFVNALKVKYPRLMAVTAMPIEESMGYWSKRGWTHFRTNISYGGKEMVFKPLVNTAEPRCFGSYTDCIIINNTIDAYQMKDDIKEGVADHSGSICFREPSVEFAECHLPIVTPGGPETFVGFQYNHNYVNGAKYKHMFKTWGHGLIIITGVGKEHYYDQIDFDAPHGKSRNNKKEGKLNE